MAKGWLRTSFHDFATYDSVANTGGIDSSIFTVVESSLPDNGAIVGGGNLAFFLNQALTYPSVSASDWIVIGAIAAIQTCGGPDLRGRFRPGRVDKFVPNDVSLLPDFRWPLSKLEDAFKRMNFTQLEYITLVVGSHTLGGANISVGSIGFGQDGSNGKAFDSTQLSFDNQIFKKALTTPMVLDSDNLILGESGAMSLVQLYASNQSAFFDAYAEVYIKMVEMGHSNLGCRLDGVGCTTEQLADTPIPNQIQSIPNAWSTGLGDWITCYLNKQCTNGCCSKELSNDGLYKCTPQGTLTLCTGDTKFTTSTTTMSASTTSTVSISSTTTKSTTTLTTSTSQPSPVKLGDWAFCDKNSQCVNNCCSNQYSGDGKFKCTPGGSQCTGNTQSSTIKSATSTSTIIASPSSSPTKLSDWNFCTSNNQCINNCCSKEYSGDGKFKCTPFGKLCTGETSVSTTKASTTKTSSTTSKVSTSTALATNLSDWQFCSKNSQCVNKCCSKQYSNDGNYKCTPGGTSSLCKGSI
ncbi:hypothetical protein HK096_011325 [Nowakowskiella sp. JEL0078]|nr:hypothetical protein HK096_011325 [Nowakowskiella sp. JEL0078]